MKNVKKLVTQHRKAMFLTTNENFPHSQPKFRITAEGDYRIIANEEPLETYRITANSDLP